MDISQNVVLPKKRGRKPKNHALNNTDAPPVEKPPPKKRGRKPKGGKIVSLNGNNTASLLLAITTLFRPESTVPTSSAVNSANSWNPVIAFKCG